MTFNFSEAARQALDSDGPALVLGGPGSGKTTLSLFKAQRLIPGLAPGQEVLFLSFSRAAVHQVELRCKGVLTRDERRVIKVKTYHAFCMEVLQTHGRLLTGRQPRILTPRDERLKKSTHDGEWSDEQQRLADEDALFAFDLFASSTANLLSRAKCVRELLADRYPVVILDEFQDTNDAQWDLVQRLAEGSRVIVLADPDQRIFEYDPTVDPRRLDHLRDAISPEEFDLGAENHRSPGSGILDYADAVLHNRPLPKVSEVSSVTVWPNAFDATVHAGVVWLLSALAGAGIARPSVAVLSRTNLLVSQISDALSRSHALNGRTYRPVEHTVVWDAELAAAAAGVVASMLEWPEVAAEEAAMRTLGAIADFYDIKNAVRPSNAARETASKFQRATQQVADGRAPRTKAAKHILASSQAGIDLVGRPVEDWKHAQSLLTGASELEEVHRHSRFVRLFRASGEIGPQLAERWADSGTYGPAKETVRRAIDQATLLSTRTDPRGVVLMTMHKSKGKEFDGVVLVEGAHASPFLSVGREPAPYHESRRLLRVGITRARSRVLIVRSATSPPLVGTYD